LSSVGETCAPESWAWAPTDLWVGGSVPQAVKCHFRLPAVDRDASRMSPFVSNALAQAPLPADVEFELAQQAAAGDAAAREELICAGLRLVVLHGLRLGHRGEALEEAVAAGTEGLICAVDRFDPTRGTRLATYAWQWIARAMMPAHNLATFPDFADRSHANTAGSSLLAELPPEQAKVLGLRFGLLTADGLGLTIREVSQQLRLSHWQVRQLEAKALSRLRRRVDRVGCRAPVVGADPL